MLLYARIVTSLSVKNPDKKARKCKILKVWKKNTEIVKLRRGNDQNDMVNDKTGENLTVFRRIFKERHMLQSPNKIAFEAFRI